MKHFEARLSITTQGPTYPPSEIMDEDQNFIVIGKVNDQDEAGELHQYWGAAVVSSDFEPPAFGQNEPYPIVRPLDFNNETELDRVLYTLPMPLPCNNYPMLFAPEQKPHANEEQFASTPLHEMHIPDFRPCDGRKMTSPITLRDWLKASGELTIDIAEDKTSALFHLSMQGLIPNSLYTVMSLRSHDLRAVNPSRPGPLGIPNVFITDSAGNAEYYANMPNPFSDEEGTSRIINVVVLWMSQQMSHGGAIGYYGLGGDIHAQLKLSTMIPNDMVTYAETPQ